jgi:hypothetical protein
MWINAVSSSGGDIKTKRHNPNRREAANEANGISACAQIRKEQGQLTEDLLCDDGFDAHVSQSFDIFTALGRDLIPSRNSSILASIVTDLCKQSVKTGFSFRKDPRDQPSSPGGAFGRVLCNQTFEAKESPTPFCIVINLQSHLLL